MRAVGGARSKPVALADGGAGGRVPERLGGHAEAADAEAQARGRRAGRRARGAEAPAGNRETLDPWFRWASRIGAPRVKEVRRPKRRWKRRVSGSTRRRSSTSHPRYTVPMVIDFTEIPRATEGPNRDAFEQFARDLLMAIGLEQLEGPDRGPDGGRDLLMLERRPGLLGASELRWLVSCKHHAHSGRSVRPQEEINVVERLEAVGADGFLAVYSTLPSSGLANNLNGLRRPGRESVIWDGEFIESMLLNHRLSQIVGRYFPRSSAAWQRHLDGTPEGLMVARHRKRTEAIRDGWLEGDSE